MSTIQTVEAMTPEDIQRLIDADKNRKEKLKQAREKFVAKHKEKGDWSEKKAAYNRKYTQMKKAKKLEAEAEASEEFLENNVLC